MLPEEPTRPADPGAGSGGPSGGPPTSAEGGGGARRGSRRRRRSRHGRGGEGHGARSDAPGFAPEADAFEPPPAPGGRPAAGEPSLLEPGAAEPILLPPEGHA